MKHGIHLLAVTLFFALQSLNSYAQEVIVKDGGLSKQTEATFKKVEKEAKKNAPKIVKPQKIEINHGNYETGLDPFETGSEKSGVSISVNKNHNDISDVLSKAYRAMVSGQYESAIALYKKALKVDARNQNALFGLAASYQKNAQPDHARKVYSRLLEIYPSNQAAMNNFLALAGEESVVDAIERIKKLQSANPLVAETNAQLAMLYKQVADSEKAVLYMQRAVSIDPANPVYRYNLAVIYDSANNYNAAIALYKSLLEDFYQGKQIPASAQQISERVTYLMSTLDK